MTCEHEGLLVSAQNLLLGYWQVVRNTSIHSWGEYFVIFLFDVVPLGMMTLSNTSECSLRPALADLMLTFFFLC